VADGEFGDGEAKARDEHDVTWVVKREIGIRQMSGHAGDAGRVVCDAVDGVQAGADGLFPALPTELKPRGASCCRNSGNADSIPVPGACVAPGGGVAPTGSPAILFILDELRRLRNMPPVDESLNIGRRYGLRLWMFAQSLGQLHTAYQNADGMPSSCAVRIFMNPSGADGLAERISAELGYVESLNDNSRRRLAEAADLAGPAYRDRQIVIANGAKLAIVSKDFAYQSAEFTARMNAR
jgi:hypothetical protein